ncbi:hypothetical protein CVT26_010497 [Gymnopilus dilepis]|uniref:DUF3835 domain-containing protein n=1 Tax=Gymnopilus dilepis TaxID=231916 RepID=A0A409W4Y6_9AGAR|nr:hypothetical protein CVT26_010497 [Gymnopilus dilepis]
MSIADNTQNLAEGSQESLRALIQAIIPEANVNADGKMSADAVERLTEKLTELMGPEAAQGFQHRRNERGELVNEEGLPIIDISEPDDSVSRSIPPPITVEPLIPLASLPDATRERLRQKRNRILDLLEEEERQAEILEARRESEEREEILRKRKEEALKEKDKLQKARELQKKMGRALLQNMGKAKEKEEKEREAQRIQDEEADKRRSPSMKKKTVAFAETLEQDAKEVTNDSSSKLKWGDLTPGRLRNSKRPTLMSQSLLDKHPMKMTVVERFPATGQPSHGKVTLQSQGLDSDDESEPDADDASATADLSGEEEEQVLEQDEIDFDFAQHQREIALEYYQKRATIGQDAAAAMTNHSHTTEDDMDVDIEATRGPSKPAISQFRASRLASAFSATTPRSLQSSSTSLGASVVPESSTRTIQRAIRTGKLDDDGKLVGAEVDSASEDEDAAVQEVLELLRKGEVYNLGPEGDYLHIVPPQGSSTDPQAGVSAPSTQKEVSKPSSELPPPSMRSKTSKFKASRAAAGRPPTSNQASISGAHSPDSRSPSITPVSHVGRSSPKLDTPTVLSPDVEKRAPLSGQIQGPAKTSIQSPPAFSMIVDSPSFPMPRSPAGPIGSWPSETSMPPMTIDSLSFPPRTTRRPDRPPTVIASTVRESKPVAPSTTTIDSTSIPSVQNPRRSDRPPIVIAANVRESRPPASTQSPAGTSPGNSAEKVSKFKAERNRT